MNEYLLSSSQAASLLGVHESTIKRWCETEGLDSRRTAGGHRRLELARLLDFARSREVKAALLGFPGLELALAGATFEAESGRGTRGWQELLLTWLLDGPTYHVPPFLDFLVRDRGLSLAFLFDRIFAPVLEEIGRLWHSGRIGIGQEHVASRILLEALSGLRADLRARRTGPLDGLPCALVGCADGSFHEAGASFARMVLEDQGWAVLYLGPGAPYEEIVRLQRRHSVRLVCLSFIPPHGPAEALRCLRTLEEGYDPSHPYHFVMGGKNLSEGFEAAAGLPERIPRHAFSSLLGFEEWLKTEGPSLCTDLPALSPAFHPRWRMP